MGRFADLAQLRTFEEEEEPERPVTEPLRPLSQPLPAPEPEPRPFPAETVGAPTRPAEARSGLIDGQAQRRTRFSDLAEERESPVERRGRFSALDREAGFGAPEPSQERPFRAPEPVGVPEEPEEEPERDISLGRSVGAESVRAGFGVVGGLLGPPGAALATFPGEAIAQTIEGRFSPARFASEFAINVGSSFIPGSRLAVAATRAQRLRQIGKLAAKGAGIGIAASGATQLAEEGRIDPTSTLAAGAVSGLLGGAIGRSATRGRTPGPPKFDVIPRGIDEELIGRKAGESVGESLASLGGKNAPPFSAADLDAIEAEKILGEMVSRRQAGQQAVVANIPELVVTATVARTKRMVDTILKGGPQGLARIGDLEKMSGERLNVAVLQAAKEQGILEDTTGAIAMGQEIGMEAVFSASGMTNQQMSRIRKAMQEILPNQIQRAVGKDALKNQTIASQLNNLRRSLMVSQLRTQVRNAIFNQGRFFLDGMDEGIRDILRGEGVKQGAITGFRHINVATKALFSKGFREEMQQAGQAMSERVPKEYMRFASSRGIGAILGGPAPVNRGTIDKISEFVQTVGNATLGKRNEAFMRRVTAHANLMTTVARRQRAGELPKGVPLHEMIAGTRPNAKIRKDDISDALERGLEITMAGRPVDSELAKWFVNAVEGSAGKWMTLILPFPQFMARRMQFFTDFNPAGPLKLFGSDPRNADRALMGDPEAIAKQLSRATLGTFGLAAGFEILDRYGVPGGPWYRISLEAAPQSVRDALGIPDDAQTDIEVFDPASAYLGLARAIKDVTDTGEINMNGDELSRLFLSLGRLDSAGQLAAGIIDAEMMTDATGMVRFRDLLTRTIGDYLSVATAPVKPALDLMTAIGAMERSKVRDVREAPVIAPLLRQSGRLGELAAEAFDIPFPEQPRSTTGSVERQDIKNSELFEQFFGIRIFHGDVVEQELRKVGIDPFREVGPKPQTSSDLGFGERIAGRRVGRELQRTGNKLLGERLPQLLRDLQPVLARTEDRTEARKIVKERISQLRTAVNKASEGTLTMDEKRIRALTKPAGSIERQFRQKRARERAIETGQLDVPDKLSGEVMGFGRR